MRNNAEAILYRIIKKAIASEIDAVEKLASEKNLSEYEKVGLQTQSTMSLSLIAPAYEFMKKDSNKTIRKVGEAMEIRFLELIDKEVLYNKDNK